MTFERNLCLALAHSAVYFSREEYSPGGIVDGACAKDSDAPDPTESTRDTMAAFLQFLPQFMQQQMNYGPQLEASKLHTSQINSPQWGALQQKLFETYGPAMGDVAAQIDARGKYSGAVADRDILAGPGAEAFGNVTDMMRESDPEFFAIREQAGAQVSDLLGSGLTGAEEEAINRKQARDRVNSGITTPTSTNTVAEAMQFGDAARNRQMQGIGAATSFLPASRLGLDPTSVALGRPSVNTGDSKFLGVQQPASAENSTNNFFNQIAGFQSNAMNIDAQQRDILDRINESVGSINV